jgi:hypothetical protein
VLSLKYFPFQKTYKMISSDNGTAIGSCSSTVCLKKEILEHAQSQDGKAYSRVIITGLLEGVRGREGGRNSTLQNYNR